MFADQKGLEELAARVAAALDETQGMDGSTGDVKSLQKRSIMILQQFYKLLLSDFSPAEWKESKAYLRTMGFPSLRDTLRIKPSKLPERLGKCMEKFYGPEDRRKQLSSYLARLEEAVGDLDDAIFASGKVSKKAEKAVERLEELEGWMQDAVSLMKKLEMLRREADRIALQLPPPLGPLNQEALARERHKLAVEDVRSELEALEQRDREVQEQLSLAMGRFKEFLGRSGRHLNLIVSLLPLIREITAPYVKFDSDELTDWEVSVAIKNMSKHRSKLQDDHPLMKSDEESIVEALHHLMESKEAIADYNSIRRLQRSVSEIASMLEKKREQLGSVEGEAQLRRIEAEVAQRIEESRHDHERVSAQIGAAEAELNGLFEMIGLDTDPGFAELKAEVNELLEAIK